MVTAAIMVVTFSLDRNDDRSVIVSVTVVHTGSVIKLTERNGGGGVWQE